MNMHHTRNDMGAAVEIGDSIKGIAMRTRGRTPQSMQTANCNDPIHAARQLTMCSFRCRRRKLTPCFRCSSPVALLRQLRTTAVRRCRTREKQRNRAVKAMAQIGQDGQLKRGRLRGLLWLWFLGDAGPEEPPCSRCISTRARCARAGGHIWRQHR